MRGSCALNRGRTAFLIALALTLAAAPAAVAALAPTGSIATASPQALGAPAPPALTGNLLILLDRSPRQASAARVTVEATIARFGAQPAGVSVPQIGLITVHPPAGVSPTSFERVLRRLPGVASVSPERTYVLRAIPDDPALTAAQSSSGVVQWALAREDFYNAWNISTGTGALVGVIDTGVDATQPDLVGKLAAAVDQQTPSNSTGPANTDQDGHGTHVASLACANTDNGIGMAGAGFNCKLVIEKTDFTQSSIDAAIVDATNRHVDAINMSFGSNQSSSTPPADELRALQYAAARKVVLVAAAADSRTTQEGDPADVLQPSGTGPNLNAGLGLDVTAADYDGGLASFAGSGTEISMAAFGALDPSELSFYPGVVGPPPGIFGAFPANRTSMESFPDPCRCRTTFDGSSSWAYLQGTSMAAPQVAAVAAMMRVLNPFASLQDILRILKQTAQRPSGQGWSPELGWGILDAGAALAATQRLDRLPPVSHMNPPDVRGPGRFLLSWTGRDQHYGTLIPSGIAYYDVYESYDGKPYRLIDKTTRHTLRFRGIPGQRYMFYTAAVDRAGNREMHPARDTTRVFS
jgi:serine protease